MRVRNVGELTNYGSYWRLVYDTCGDAQEFAREGLDDPEAAAFFVKRHYADCLSCTRSREKAGRSAQNDVNLAVEVLCAIISRNEGE